MSLLLQNFWIRNPGWIQLRVYFSHVVIKEFRYYLRMHNPILTLSSFLARLLACLLASSIYFRHAIIYPRISGQQIWTTWCLVTLNLPGKERKAEGRFYAQTNLKIICSCSFYRDVNNQWQGLLGTVQRASTLVVGMNNAFL